MRWLGLIAGTVAGLAGAAQAQVVQGVSQTSPSGETTTVFTVTPTAGLSATDYVKQSADAFGYEAAAASLAMSRAQRDDVKAFARQVADHAATGQKTLLAALSNGDRKITRPSATLSGERKADLELLRRAPRSGFDTLYLSQHVSRAPGMWAIQKGYATGGTDQPLQQVASGAVPVIEQDYTAARALTPAGASDLQ